MTIPFSLPQVPKPCENCGTPVVGPDPSRPLCILCRQRQTENVLQRATGVEAFTVGYSVFAAAVERERRITQALAGLQPRFEVSPGQRLLEQAAAGGPGFEAQYRAMQQEIRDMQEATAESQARTLVHLEQIATALEPIMAVLGPLAAIVAARERDDAEVPLSSEVEQ